ncbi:MULTISPECIES: hypothetical protein [Dyella]|uniref:PH domain-containing protein n=2 Tax=Dyella TaxID=231454 RepID=A0A4R0YJ17_9GAMM|nr:MULTISPECIES: hypothetical protein [Dyella]TBR36456.1 hypothetical protein EYV96_10955 [Dyella terrae]TCI08452.1 hypothetical protein EZM97_27915 [Dyella soli]
MQGHPDQGLRWTEPRAVTRLKARAMTLRQRLGLLAILTVVSAVWLVCEILPSSLFGWEALAAIALVIGWLWAYPVMWLNRNIHNMVSLTPDAILGPLGNHNYLFIAWGYVGTVEIDGKPFQVMVYKVHHLDEVLYGIGEEVDANAVAAFLKRKGVREPDGGTAPPRV